MNIKDSIAVFHGGPGLSYSYCKLLANRYADQTTFLFNDAPGCTLATANVLPTLDQTIESFDVWFRNVYDNGVRSVLAHSWGALVLYMIVASRKFDEPFRISLWNPVPLDRTSYDEAVARLVARVTPEASASMSKAAEDLGVGAGQKIMEIAWEFYSPDAVLPPGLSFDYFETTFSSVSVGLGQFDLWSNVRERISDTEFVFAAKDYILPADFTKSLGSDFIPRIVPGGHFAFLEEPRLFERSLEHLLRRK